MKNSFLLVICILISVCGFAQTDSALVENDTMSIIDLQGVEVTAQRKLYVQKADRLVFNVENSIIAESGDALDALKITPNIRVNNNNISMVGKDQMSVMVDERLLPISGEQLMNYLKSIPSNSIKSIEVITTPPAKYDAQGNSGIINIVLKKEKQDNWNVNLRANAAQGHYLYGGLGVDFNFKKGKWSVLANVHLGKNNSTSESNDVYDYTSEFWKSSFFFKNFTDLIAGNLGANYQITNKLSAGIYTYGYANVQNKESKNNIFIYNNPQQENLKALYQSDGTAKTRFRMSSVNFNLKQKLDTLGKVINFDFDYFGNSHNADNPFFTTNTYYNPNVEQAFYTTNSSRPKLINYSTRLDFDLPYKWGTLNFGAKYSNSENRAHIYENFYEINNSENNLYLSQDNHFTYQENYEALYFSLEKIFNEHWQAKAGLRMEAVQTKGVSESTNEQAQTNKNNYVEFFPTAYLAYNVANHQFSTSYSRRIERPNFNYLNPSRFYQNLNIYSVGNPFLRPSFSQNFSLNYVYNNFLTSILWYDKISDGYGNLSNFNNDEIITSTQNYYNYIKTGITENLNFNIVKWWNIYANFTFWYMKTETFSQYLEPDYSGWGAYFSINNYFNLNKAKTFFAELNFWYTPPTQEQDTKMQAGSNLSAGLRYLIFNKKMRISLTANDVLGTNIYRGKRVTQGVVQTFRSNNDNQYIRLSISYKFGNDNIYVRQNEGSNAEEKQRGY
jgi:hypothetical protein